MRKNNKNLFSDVLFSPNNLKIAATHFGYNGKILLNVES